MTRETILRSARSGFAAKGYDGIGVRQIASDAGVSAMLVNRYFGSKEGLFREVLTTCMREAEILTDNVLAEDNPVNLANNLAKALINKTAAEVSPLDGFMILLRSMSNEVAAAIWREQIETYHQKNLAEVLSGVFKNERSAIILSLILGFQTMRKIVGLHSLEETNDEHLVRILTATLYALTNSENA